MKALVEYIARSLVSEPDQVNVTEVVEEGHVTLHLEVAPQDKGKVIGRQGRSAQAMRSLLRVAGVKQNARVFLDIE